MFTKSESIKKNNILEIFLSYNIVKRYNSNLTKNNKKIEYSEYIDLNKYTLNYNKKPNKYKLESICIQDGSYGGGHYYSM